MQTLEQILQMVEREKDSIHTFVEHMGIILNNIEDPLTKELLAHLVEEEEEHFARIQELIPALQGYLANGGGEANQANHATPANQANQEATAGHAVPVHSVASQPQSGSSRRLSIGSLVQY